MVVYIFVVVRLLVKLMLRDGKRNDFIGKQTLTMHDEYIEDENSATSSQTKYTAVEKICYGYGCYYIYIGSMKAFVIPEASFSSEMQKQDFLSLLARKTGLEVICSKRSQKKL